MPGLNHQNVINVRNSPVSVHHAVAFGVTLCYPNEQASPTLFWSSQAPQNVGKILTLKSQLPVFPPNAKELLWYVWGKPKRLFLA